MQTPEFPNFIQVDISHKELVKEATSHLPSYSDFNFSSMFSWDTEGVNAISTLNGNLVARFKDYTTDGVFLSFLGTKKLEETISTLLKYGEHQGVKPGLHLIGQHVVDLLDPSFKDTLLIEEDRDSHDYILSVHDLCELRTGLYGTKKRMHNRFIRDHGERSKCAVLDLTTEETRQDIQQTVSAWQKSMHRSEEQTRGELTALERCLDKASELGVEGYGTYYNNRLVAFTLYETLPGHIIMGHFLKADVELEGVFIHLLHNFALHVRSKGIKFMNIEQDLGIEGLRQSKEALKPTELLKKFSVSKKS